MIGSDNKSLHNIYSNIAGNCLKQKFNSKQKTSKCKLKTNTNSEKQKLKYF